MPWRGPRMHHRGRDEVGVLDGRYTGRDHTPGFIERGVHKHQCEPGLGPVRWGRVGERGPLAS